MTKGMTKNILLALAGVTVVAVSIYLSRSGQRGGPAVPTRGPWHRTLTSMTPPMRASRPAVRDRL